MNGSLIGKVVLAVHRHGRPQPMVRLVPLEGTWHRQLDALLPSPNACRSLIFSLRTPGTREVVRITWAASSVIARHQHPDLSEHQIARRRGCGTETAFFEPEGMERLIGHAVAQIIPPLHPWPNPGGQTAWSEGDRRLTIVTGQRPSAAVVMRTGHQDGRNLAIYALEDVLVIPFRNASERFGTRDGTEQIAGGCVVHEDCLDHPDLGLACVGAA